MPRPYDHTAFANKLEQLAAFKRAHGHTNVPQSHSDKSLVNWVAAQKKAFAARRMPTERSDKLLALGFVFPGPRPNGGRASGKQPSQVAPVRESSLEAQLRNAFDNRFEQLSKWLDETESQSGQRNLVYRDTQTSDLARNAYSFVEQMTLQAQQGRLADTHRTRLMMLAFTVNGRAIDGLLTVSPAVEPQPIASNSRTDHTSSEETSANGEASREVTRLDERESPYLTTQELARRLNYDPRTIREVLKDRVLIEERHYVRPFGRRKILWIWETIHADMRKGLFKLSTAGAKIAAQ